MKEVRRIVDEQADDPEKVQLGHLSEHSETERLETAADHLSQMEGLQPETWSALPETKREWCLRQVGQRLSEAYECPAPPFIGSQMLEVDGGVLLGAYSDPEYITRLNRELLRENDVGKALGTYCHEFRHAYQHEMATRYNSAFRHLCHDETAAARWAENLDGRYVSFETNPEGYAAQSVEKDARDFADRLKEEVAKRRAGRSQGAA